MTAIQAQERAMDQKTFEATLRSYKRNARTAIRLSRLLAEAAIIHFADHGQVAYCQAFHDAMPKNFARRAAFMTWLTENAPITMQGGKLKKDKDDKAVVLNLERALAKPFWDYKPEVEWQPITETDVIKNFVRYRDKLIKARDNKDDNGLPAPKITETAASLIPDLDDLLKRMAEETGQTKLLESPAAVAVVTDDGEPTIDTSDDGDEDVVDAPAKSASAA